MPEKLLTSSEAARRLGISEQELARIVQAGQLKAIRLGGELVRFHPDDVDTWRPPSTPTLPRAPDRPTPPASPASAWERLWDFFYAYDFYLFAVGLVAVIVAFILVMQH